MTSPVIVLAARRTYRDRTAAAERFQYLKRAQEYEELSRLADEIEARCDHLIALCDARSTTPEHRNEARELLRRIDMTMAEYGYASQPILPCDCEPIGAA